MTVNVEHSITANKLVITIDIGKAACDRARPSSTGKTMIVAGTEGSVKIKGPPGWNLTYSLNVMGKPTGE